MTAASFNVINGGLSAQENHDLDAEIAKLEKPIEYFGADEVKQQSVKWLWENRFALGKITLIGGYPGVGKSQLVIDLIARMTSNGRWPTGELAVPGNAVILSSEDDAADTICPRLEAAGADLRGVTILGRVCDTGRRRTFSLQSDLDSLIR
jgi:RecA-family ATPase